MIDDKVKRALRIFTGYKSFARREYAEREGLNYDELCELLIQNKLARKNKAGAVSLTVDYFQASKLLSNDVESEIKNIKQNILELQNELKTAHWSCTRDIGERIQFNYKRLKGLEWKS